MKILNIEVEVHWGYSIKVASIGKSQPALYIPPPSTLVGAISLPLAKNRDMGETLSDGTTLFNTLSLFKRVFVNSACKLIGKGTYWEDINRYIISLYQRPGRRSDPNYRFNAIPTGKIFVPHQKIRILYLIDEKASIEILGQNWQAEIIISAWEISRLGNKESIVSVERVSLNDALTVKNRLSATSFYFPNSAADIIDGDGEFFYSDFWVNNYEFGKEAQIERYVVPGYRAPIVESSTLQVKIKGIAYSNGEDIMIVNT
jgi:CRISPR-associated protein Cas5a/b/c